MMASILAFMSLLLCLTVISVGSYTKEIFTKTNKDTTNEKIKNFCFAVCLGFILISGITLVLVNEYINNKESQELLIK